MVLRIFNLDLHISVIEDIKDISSQLFGDKIEITNWSISGHNFVFNKPTPNVKGVNQDSWKSFSYSHIEEFHNAYDNILQSYDGFIVTHTPVFCMLFEKYKKPIICINTCRYDQPFCWNKNDYMKTEFHNCLHRLIESNQLHIISNNLADYNYLLENTNIKSSIIPSLCLYTNSSYTPTHDSFVVYGNYNIFSKHKLIVEKPKTGYSWSDLYKYKGIVHTPYEMSTMSIFEQMWAGVPLFFPTKRFYKECIINGTMDFISMYNSWGTPICEADIDKWLSFADFYTYPIFYYYDSFEDLHKQLETFNDSKKEERIQWIEQSKKDILEQWKQILVQTFPSLYSKPPRTINIVTRHCNGTSNPAIRPNGFDKEQCLEQLLKTKDEHTNITIFFDGDPTNHFVTKYPLKIVPFENGGSDAKSMRGLVQFLSEQSFDDDSILYIVEDDFMHKPGWPTILREAFSGNMKPDNLQPDYVTLYDHLDKYTDSMYENLQTRIGITKSCHWRTIPSTVNTCAMLFKTFLNDINVFYTYTTIDDNFAYDHRKFLHLNSLGRTLVSCIPSYSTHMQTNVLAPCIDWSKVYCYK